MANDIEKFMKQAAEIVVEDLKKEIGKLVPNTPLPYETIKEGGLLGEMVGEILSPTFTKLEDILGITKQGRIDTSEVFVKIDQQKLKARGFDVDGQFLLNIYSNNDTEDKKIRLTFYGGEAQDKDGEELVISPVQWVTTSDTAQNVAMKLQEVFTEKLSEKAKKIAMQLEIKEGVK